MTKEKALETAAEHFDALAVILVTPLFESGYYGDAIDVYMRLNTCGFVDAVKEVQ